MLNFNRRFCVTVKELKFLRVFWVVALLIFAQYCLADLPRAAQIDRYKNMVTNAIKRKDCVSILDNIRKLEQLTQDLPESMVFAEAECFLQAGNGESAMKVLEVYIATLGKDGEYYQRALDAYTKAENLTAMRRNKSGPSGGNEGKEVRRVEDVLDEISAEMVEVPAGCFQMGASPSDIEKNIDEAQHKVCLTQTFLIGKYEISQSQWEAVMRQNPSSMSKCGPNCPVERVNWRDVNRFIEKLNDATGLKYRLPTEAEWEYTCRGGGKAEKYCGGDYIAELAWYDSNSKRRTHTRGQKQANALGVFDMSGNVSEHVADRYDENYYLHSVENDPQGPEQGFARVIRGGSWRDSAKFSRAANRRRAKPGRRGDFLGFRLARNR